MWKKWIVAVIGFVALMSTAFADVDANKADQVALDGLRGLGPAKSKAIIEERTKNGPFKDWPDFQKRVKGIGDVTSTRLSEAGLTINGQAKPGADKASDAPKKSSEKQEKLKAEAKEKPKTEPTKEPK